MSVEEFEQFGSSDRFARGQFYEIQTLSGAVEWPGEHESSGDVERNVPPVTADPHARQRRSRWIWQVLTVLLLAGMLGASGMLYYLDQTFAGLIYPNVAIQGIQVGQMAAEDAVQVLQERYAPFLQQPVTLSYGDQTWSPSLADLGVRLEIDATVQQALAAGRGHDPITNLWQVMAVWERGLDLPIHLTIDQAQMQRYVLARAAEVEQSAVDAELVLRGTQVGMRVAVPGRQVLVNDTIQDLTAALQSLEPQTVVLRTRTLAPLLTDADVAAAQRTVEDLLQGPLTLKIDDAQWEWSERDLAQMVQIQRITRSDGSGEQLTVTLDREQLRQRLKTIAGSTGSNIIHPRVDWNGGNLKIIRAGQPGRQLDETRAEQLILAAAFTPRRTINLPVHIAQPTITEATIAQLSIPDLLAVGRSDFSGSAAYRITNIKAGMNLLHGILLAPGEEFSFNENIGAIDASNGFVEGYAIIQNRTQLEWGGGICQDSTTMFRAAFWAGLPITERWGHSFYISWYDKYGYGEYGNGPGMDATIFTGGPDLKFVNDTGNWLLIQTYVDPSRALAEVRIYGTDTNRTVELEGPVISNRTSAPTTPVYVADPARPRGAPRQSDTARGGMDITFTRIVKENGAVVDRETFLTRFKPWPNIFEVNPADMPGARPNPVVEQGEPELEETPPADSGTPAPPAETPQPPAAPPSDAQTTIIVPPGDVVPIVPPGDVAPVAPPGDGTTPAPQPPAEEPAPPDGG